VTLAPFSSVTEPPQLADVGAILLTSAVVIEGGPVKRMFRLAVFEYIEPSNTWNDIVRELLLDVKSAFSNFTDLSAA
jgi:hypothetical protein